VESIRNETCENLCQVQSCFGVVYLDWIGWIDHRQSRVLRKKKQVVLAYASGEEADGKLGGGVGDVEG
jgi:hypothetical protein